MPMEKERSVGNAEPPATGEPGRSGGGRSSPARPSSEAARRRMQAARGRDTAAEELLRAELTRLGLTYVVDEAPLPRLRRRADVVFPDECVAVFVDGCFWHGCETHGTWPKANAEFWRDKIEANRRRDSDTNERLAREGWRVMRFWEHDDPVEAALAVARAVSGH